MVVANSERVTNLGEYFADAENRKKLWRAILHRGDWKEVFSRVSDKAIDAMVMDVAEEMSIEQLTLLIVRMHPEMRSDRKTTRRTDGCSVFVVYWLVMIDEPEIPVYVGQTRNLKERWRAHRGGCSATASLNNRESLRIKVVETVMGSEADAWIAERRHITEALKLNDGLLNRRVK